MALVIIDRYQPWIGRTLTLHNPSFATLLTQRIHCQDDPTRCPMKISLRTRPVHLLILPARVFGPHTEAAWTSYPGLSSSKPTIAVPVEGAEHHMRLLIRDEEVFSREAPDRDGWLGSQADMSLPRTMPLGLCGL